MKTEHLPFLFELRETIFQELSNSENKKDKKEIEKYRYLLANLDIIISELLEN